MHTTTTGIIYPIPLSGCSNVASGVFGSSRWLLSLWFASFLFIFTRPLLLQRFRRIYQIWLGSAISRLTFRRTPVTHLPGLFGSKHNLFTISRLMVNDNQGALN